MPSPQLLNPIAVSRALEERYRDYLRHHFRVHNSSLRAAFEDALQQENLLLREPFISISAPFELGDSLTTLGVRPRIADRFGRDAFSNSHPYKHQSEAYKRIRRGDPTVVATGTGSGKTEAFLLPIIDYCDEHRIQTGPKAILLYPMNALALDQNRRIGKLVAGLEISFGAYTGATDRGSKSDRPAESPLEERINRQEFRDSPPDLFLTNYQMLEYLLIRGDGRDIFAKHNIRYIVLDEVHAYHGALGVDVALLLRRLVAALHAANPDAPEPVFVGTSATLQAEEGADPRIGVAEFFERLTGQHLEIENVIQEHSLRHAMPPGAAMAPSPQITREEIEGYNPSDPSAAAALVEKLTGIHGGDPARAFASTKLPYVLQSILGAPRALSYVIDAVAMLPERAGVARDAVEREVLAALLVGPALGSDSPIHLRPRVHRFVQGLPPFWRCARPSCGQLSVTEREHCSACGGVVLPLALCRACGWDYFVVEPQPVEGAQLTRARPWTSPRSDEQRTAYLFAFDAHADLSGVANAYTQTEDDAQPDEDETEVASEETDEDVAPEEYLASLRRRVETKCSQRRLCGNCGALYDAAGDCPSCGADDAEQRALYQLTGRGTQCPICTATYVRGEQLAPVRLGNSPALTWIARTLLEALPQNDRRLLVFCDSRQDAAHQARYIDGVEKTLVAKRAIYATLAGRSAPADVQSLQAAIVPALVTAGELIAGKTADQRDRNAKKATGKLLDAFVYKARRKDSLERLGLVRVESAGLTESLQLPEFDALVHGYALDTAASRVGARLVLETMRLRFACHLDATSSEDPLRERLYQWGDESRREVAIAREYGIIAGRRIGKPTVFADVGRNGAYNVNEYVVQAAWGTTGRGSLRDVWLKAVGKKAPRESLEALLRFLEQHGHIARVSVGQAGGKRINGYSVPLLGHIEFTVAHTACACAVCSRVVGDATAGDLCPEPHCDGRLLESPPPLLAGNIEAELIAGNESVGLRASEHSAALPAEERDRVERAFQSHPPEINVLACTPTLELGVNIGALEAVAMRNVPPNPANYAQRAGRTGRRSRMGVVTTFVRPLPHDAYFFDHPEEMIAGAIPAPRFNLRNREALARHAHSISLETARIAYPQNLEPWIEDEGECNAAGIESLLTQIRAAIPEAKDRSRRVFASVDGYDAAAIEAWIDETPDRVQAALVTRSEIIKVASDRMHRLDAPGATRTRKAQQERDGYARLARALRSGDGRDQNAYLPRVLAEAGVTPGYAFPSDPGSLSLGLEPDLLFTSRIQAQREYAPGAIVYARGKRWEVRGASLFRSQSGAGSQRQRFIECAACRQANPADNNRCSRAECGQSLEAGVREFIDIASFAARLQDVDPLTEEERLLRRVDSRPHPQMDVPRIVYALSIGEDETAKLEFARQEAIWWINHGRFDSPGGTQTKPFRICMRCGDAFDPPPTAKPARLRGKRNGNAVPTAIKLSTAEEEHQKPGHCGGEVEEFALGHATRAEILRLEVPEFLRRGPSGVEWAYSVANAIVQGAVHEFEIDDDDLETHVVIQGRDDEAGASEILWIDSVPGGTGILDAIVERFPRVAHAAVKHLEGHDCERSCYRCLRTYANARYAKLLNWRLAMPFLQNAASAELSPAGVVPATSGEQQTAAWEEARAEGCESPLELRLLRAYRDGGLPEPEKQFEVRRENGSLITRADFAWPDPRVLVYADGLLYHNLVANRVHDTRQANELQNLGWRVLRFLGREIYRNSTVCIATTQSALGAVGKRP